MVSVLVLLLRTLISVCAAQHLSVSFLASSRSVFGLPEAEASGLRVPRRGSLDQVPWFLGHWLFWGSVQDRGQADRISVCCQEGNYVSEKGGPGKTAHGEKSLPGPLQSGPTALTEQSH